MASSIAGTEPNTFLNILHQFKDFIFRAQKAIVPGVVSTFVKNNFRSSVALALMAYYLIYKWAKDKKVEILYKKTEKNIKIVKGLEELLNSYSPTFWLPGVVCKLIHCILQPDISEIAHKLMYRRVKVKLEDGEIIAVDISPRDDRTVEKNAPIVLCIPGVISTSYGFSHIELEQLVCKQLGWRMAVLNRRGYCGMPLKGSRMSALDLQTDIRQVIIALREDHPDSEIYLFGTSMGGAQVQKYLHQYSEDPGVDGVCALASTWNNEMVVESVGSNFLLDSAMRDKLKSLYYNHQDEEWCQELVKQKGIDIGKLVTRNEKKSLFDDFLQFFSVFCLILFFRGN